ncbi:tRNA-dihydrouridine(47) synthase [NAD(P)(+)]-like [Phytophthora fragariae]|uniref:tRNA-dihydrouridine(47) synthase [NAD(P)(+)] n=1 Tax=Phytophthora fragariae TaxID=53985 RepID=A0A6A4DMC7_9STRA|nr:tRNA-dihydrouridine(47) synthase [NAD(P)(+)]-like [Phytophthora fragariae]KAE8937154.1 tRNA-dihydrouridine(47) synthase [NAD(P)(+)]-like [Phytophthora fragariae]KAE9008292.1 tRNA-dihydrouridine(47) synthase [NAD(P)(+)]-like [Phytophthora fragariae]KAE9109673.1 tRNA-dihydrouridine(47) synthase [NAD(P)(+)]-like [Phytophthora fragariae]KAE9110173.1 tRNA-dihydrouridine(47) synthase [NAD(P)(+)]-like [Phytophthora fragariae]
MEQQPTSTEAPEIPTTTTTASTEAPVRELRAGEAPIKKEFLKPKPTPKPATPADAEAGDAVKATKVKDDRDREGGKKKRGGTFKKRPVDAEQDPADMLCRPAASGEGCQFGDSCKFSHDVDDYMKRKPKDLGERCPVFDVVGYCRYGMACRFAKAHIEKVDGTYRNMKHEGYVEGQDLADEVNDLTHDLRLKLRKDTYDFQSKQQMKKGKKNDKKRQQKNEKQEVKPETDAASAPAADVKTDSAPVETETETGDATMEPAAESPLLAERKPVDFKRKIYIAPLTTVGNLPFRRLLKQTGADITCGEMAMATNLLKAQQSEWALLRRHKSEDVFGVQLAGSFSDQMARVCELLARETEVDFVDINMGCPIDIVCRAGAGSALMTRPPRLLEVVSGALTGLELGTRMRTGGTVNTPGLTVKLRTGWSDKQPTAHKLVPKLQSVRASQAYVNAAVVTADFKLRATQSVDAIMVHGRSRLQRYTKNADWDYIFQCSDAQQDRIDDKDMPSVPFVGGGDVLSYEEFDEHLANGKLDTCMLARGALIKPWLPTEIKERRHWDISASERLDLLKDFVRFGLEHWGSDQKGVNRTRRYLLEWQSFLCRYIPVGLLESLPQRINDRPAPYYGRNELETLMASDQAVDWVKISEMLLGPVPDGFQFVPKHRANAYTAS